MLCVPAASAVVVRCAARPFPVPDSATAAQPTIEVAPSRKFTVPVGLMALTVAVKVTLVPNVEGFNEVATPVVLAALLTVCESVLLLDPAFAPSPPYVATIE